LYQPRVVNQKPWVKMWIGHFIGQLVQLTTKFVLFLFCHNWQRGGDVSIHPSPFHDHRLSNKCHITYHCIHHNNYTCIIITANKWLQVNIKRVTQTYTTTRLRHTNSNKLPSMVGAMLVTRNKLLTFRRPSCRQREVSSSVRTELGTLLLTDLFLAHLSRRPHPYIAISRITETFPGLRLSLPY